jgi:alkylhydroperoxidase family enzyme
MTLPLPDDATSADLAARYTAAREREGSVMAILRAQGPRPAVVDGFLALADAVLYDESAPLGRRERELLALATSEANGADYSTGVHSDLLAGRGGVHDTERDRALFAFARVATREPGRSAEAVAALREHLSDDEVYDAITTVALLNYANRCALATGITQADDLR